MPLPVGLCVFHIAETLAWLLPQQNWQSADIIWSFPFPLPLPCLIPSLPHPVCPPICLLAFLFVVSQLEVLHYRLNVSSALHSPAQPSLQAIHAYQVLAFPSLPLPRGGRRVCVGTVLE